MHSEVQHITDETTESEDLYVIRSTRIDSNNTLRRRVRIHPGVCPQCGIDFVAGNEHRLSSDTFDELTNDEKIAMQDLVAEHRRRRHTTAELPIVSGSEIPKEWLGGNK